MGIGFLIDNSNDDYVVVGIDLGDEPIAPEDLKKVRLEAPDLIERGIGNKGVVLTGRAPIWLYGFLIHFYHPTKFVAVYDPRLNGAVVVQSHSPGILPGDIIPNKK